MCQCERSVECSLSLSRLCSYVVLFRSHRIAYYLLPVTRPGRHVTYSYHMWVSLQLQRSRADCSNSAAELTVPWYSETRKNCESCCEYQYVQRTRHSHSDSALWGSHKQVLTHYRCDTYWFPYRTRSGVLSTEFWRGVPEVPVL